MRWTHPSGLLSLDVPDGWTTVDDGSPGVALVATEATSPFPLRCTIVVTTDTLGDITFRDWQLGSDQLLATTLEEYVLIDLNHRMVEGNPAGWRLAHHTVDGGLAATMVQLAVQVGEEGATVTVTMPTLRYPYLAESTQKILGSLRLGARAVTP